MSKLTDEKKQAGQRLRELAALANTEGRAWSTEDEREWIRCEKDYVALKAAAEAEAEEPQRRFGRPDCDSSRATRTASQQGDMLFRDSETGQEVRSLGENESLTDRLGATDEPQVSIGAVLANLLSGTRDYATEAEMRASIGSDSGGKYLLMPPAAAGVFDLIRPASVVLRAGATILPMTSRQANLIKVSQSPTANWRAEGQRITSSSAAFEEVVLTAKTLAGVITLTRELIEDSDNLVSTIQAEIRRELAQKLDLGLLTGLGTENQPRGILNQAGTNSIGSVGLPASYSHISAAVGDIFGNDFDGEPSDLVWIANPAISEIYDGLTDSTGQPLVPTPWAASLRKLMTSGLPTANMVVGNFTQSVIVGMRTSTAVVEIFNQGIIDDEDGVVRNAMSDMLTHIRFHLRADVAVVRPSWLTILSGVTTS